MELAKAGEREAAAIAVVLVGHVTKDGSLAGPEDARAPRRRGDRARRRALRRRCACSGRRRTGSARPRRSGVLEMGERGPRRRSPTRPGRSSPSTTGQRRAALSRRPWRAPGRSSSRSRRSTAATAYGTPDGPPAGIDPNRLALLVAVLGRRAGIGLGSHDVYANLAGGLSPRRAGPRPAPGARPGQLVPGPAGATGTVAIGEVGLLGELRR